MTKRGRFQAKRKKPAGVIVLLLILLSAAAILIFSRCSAEGPDEPLPTEAAGQTPYSVTAHLMENDIQWAEAVIRKEGDVHLYLTQQQLTQIVQAINRIPEGAFSRTEVEGTMTVHLQCGSGVIRILYDGQRIGFAAENLGTEIWSITDPALQALLEPIAKLNNTKQWISYMTLYDLQNLRTNVQTLTWEYFEDFAYWEIGAYKRMLPLEDRFYVLAEGNQDGRPVSLYLVDSSSQHNRVDIRNGDVDGFLAQYTQTNKPAISATDGFYSQEQAMIDGCPVMQDGDILHNQERWYQFAERTGRGEAASITVVHYVRKGSGTEFTRYDISYEDDHYAVRITGESQQLSTTYLKLERSEGLLDGQSEPYDRFIRYTFQEGRDTGDLVIYEDRIAQPDFAGTAAVRLHLKEGEPALMTFEEPEQFASILSLLSKAEYLEIPPENYLFGTKLIFVSDAGEEWILEMDLLQGNFRYGMQCYHYGAVEELLHVLGLKEWPAAVKEEYASYLSEAE